VTRPCDSESTVHPALAAQSDRQWHPALQLAHRHRPPRPRPATDAGRIPATSRPTGRLPGPQTRRPSRPRSDVARPPPRLRLQPGLGDLQCFGRQDLCVRMRANALAQEVRYDSTSGKRTSSGSATPVGSKPPTGATLPTSRRQSQEVTDVTLATVPFRPDPFSSTSATGEGFDSSVRTAVQHPQNTGGPKRPPVAPGVLRPSACLRLARDQAPA